MGRSFRRSPSELLSGRDGCGAAVRPDTRLPSAARGDRRHHGAARRADAAWIACSSRPGRSRASTSSRGCCSIRTTSILVELPTYTGAITAFRNVQAEMVGVRQEADGIDLGELDDTLRAPATREGGARGCCTWCRTFRTRRDCSSAGRSAAALLEWAERRDVLLVEDDPVSRPVLRGFGDRGRRPADPRRRRAGRVIYLSSFSKTLAPGFRVAWIDAPAPIAAKLELAKQAADLCTGELDQRIVYEACRRGILDRQLPMLRASLSAEARRDGRGPAARARQRADVARSARRVLPVGDAAGDARRGRDDRAARSSTASSTSRARRSSSTARAATMIRLSFSAPTPSTDRRRRSRGWRRRCGKSWRRTRRNRASRQRR